MTDKPTDNPKPTKRHKNGFRGPSPDVGKATQFKKGQKAPPGAGRPKTKLLTTAMLEFLTEYDPKTNKTNAQKAVRTIGKLMLSKDGLGAFKEFLDRTEGKVSQPHEISVLDGLAEEIQEARKRAGTKDEK